MSIIGQPKIKCDICDSTFIEGQGYGLRGEKQNLQYTDNLVHASKHICNGCMNAIVWAFDDSVKRKEKPGMRY